MVYCFSKKDCEQVTKELQARKVKCGAYHADKSLMERKYLLHNWKSQNLQVYFYVYYRWYVDILWKCNLTIKYLIKFENIIYLQKYWSKIVYFLDFSSNGGVWNGYW